MCVVHNGVQDLDSRKLSQASAISGKTGEAHNIPCGRDYRSEYDCQEPECKRDDGRAQYDMASGEHGVKRGNGACRAAETASMP